MSYISEEWMQKQELELANKQASANDANQALQAIQLNEATANLAREQLSLVEDLEVIEHLLRGHVLKLVKDGNAEIQKWCPPEDEDMIVFTEAGVHAIINAISFYANKNTLLSNYDNDTILQKMKDFSHTLNRLLFTNMEKFFVQPTNEQCIEILKEKIKRKTELRKFAFEIVGKEVDEKEIEEEFIKEIEKNIEVEIEKIRERAAENKYKHYEMLIRVVQDFVHSLYNRAYGGIERRTLREHIHTTESIGGGFNIPSRTQYKDKRNFNPMSLFRRS